MKENVFVTLISAGISLVTTILCLFFMSFLAYRFHVSDKILTVFITVTYMISCFLGGILSGRNQEKKYLRGFIVGNIYVGLLFLISFFVQGNLQFLYESHSYIVFTICLASATLGGMIA